MSMCSTHLEPCLMQASIYLCLLITEITVPQSTSRARHGTGHAGLIPQKLLHLIFAVVVHVVPGARALAQCLLTLQSEKVGIPWPALEQQRAVCLLVSHSSPPPHPLPT